jgi:hypothetical protein
LRLNCWGCLSPELNDKGEEYVQRHCRRKSNLAIHYDLGTQSPSSGIISADFMRGLAMVVMAIDHSRDFLSNVPFEPEDITHTFPAHFSTDSLQIGPQPRPFAACPPRISNRDSKKQTSGSSPDVCLLTSIAVEVPQ